MERRGNAVGCPAASVEKRRHGVAGALPYGRIYFATATPPTGPRLEVLDLASGVIKPITLLSKPPDTTIPGLAVSPDGRSLLVAQYDRNGSNIIMVERAR
jgi:hypothetical protein